VSAVAKLAPPHIEPPAAPLGRLAFVARFVRNPLLVIPQSVYEEDFVSSGGGSTPFAWVTEPSLVKTVLLDARERFQKLAQIRLLGPLLGRGVLTSEGPEWRWQRQAVAPMFRHQDLLRFVPAFAGAAQAVLRKWRARPQGAVQAIDKAMSEATFEVISATLLPSADEKFAPAVLESTGRFQRSGAWAQLFALANAPRWLPPPGRLSMRHSVQALRAAVGGVIGEQRADGSRREDLLQGLERARDPETGQSMDEERLVDNLLTFYLAGHETTAKALTWTLYLLARAPDWAEALRAEIAQVTGGHGVTAEHIDRLVLVQQVIKESIRLYPPVPLMSRQAVADTRLGPHEIRAGSSVVMPIYAIHRHRKRWQNPDEFDPLRFAPENEARIPRYQYMPFGAGPRICVGMAFAMIEATAILATLLQHARFAPLEGHEPVPIARVTLVPKGGMPLKVWVEAER
jgi:cytochrome P450